MGTGMGIGEFQTFGSLNVFGNGQLFDSGVTGVDMHVHKGNQGGTKLNEAEVGEMGDVEEMERSVTSSAEGVETPPFHLEVGSARELVGGEGGHGVGIGDEGGSEDERCWLERPRGSQNITTKLSGSEHGTRNISDGSES